MELKKYWHYRVAYDMRKDIAGKFCVFIGMVERYGEIWAKVMIDEQEWLVRAHCLITF